MFFQVLASFLSKTGIPVMSLFKAEDLLERGICFFLACDTMSSLFDRNN